MYKNIVEFKEAVSDHTICAERFGKSWFMNFCTNRQEGYLWQEDMSGNRISGRNAELGELWNLYNYWNRFGYNVSD